jgi:hypothetical protein
VLAARLSADDDRHLRDTAASDARRREGVRPSSGQLTGYVIIELMNCKLSAYRDEFTSMELDEEIRNGILVAIGRWQKNPSDSDPVAAVQQIVETMRKMPAGAARNQCMNTFVRTLGEPDTLATWLDILLDTYHKEGSDGQRICRILQSYKRHSHYGHYQLLMLVSARHAIKATASISDPASIRKIKHASQWDMLLSIWQPLTGNSSFRSAKRSEPRLLVEPAHSHPFDFVSRVVIGTIYESTYRPATKEASSSDKGRYAAVPLVRVDGTWPPHERREEAWLMTVEDRVSLRAGDSYFLPSDVIHDVEMDLTVSLSKPAITLMLTAESTVLADVYLEQPMLEFHDANPDLRSADCEMPFSNWNMILTDTAAYLRGADTLQLPGAPIADAFLVH